MAKIQGRYSAIKVGTSPAAVVGVTDWDFPSTADEIEVTAIGDTQKQYLQGLKDVRLSGNGFYDPADTPGQQVIIDAYESDATVPVRLYPKSSDGSYWAGNAKVLNWSMSGAASGAVTVAFSFRFIGSLTTGDDVS